MNVSMPQDVRGLVRQAAISTAAMERESVDDSAWIVRAICEKLLREWECLGLGQPIPDGVRRLAVRPRLGTLQLLRVGSADEGAGAF
jgi:hypothetical protein